MLYPVFRYTMLDNALNEFLNNNRAAHVQTTTPAINVKENQAGYEIELAAPGMTKDDFHVEFSYANFEQRLQLPDDVDRDKIIARVEDGVLRIGLPRKTERGDHQKY